MPPLLTARVALVLLIACRAALAADPVPAASQNYEGDIWKILESRCVSCHGPDNQEGGISFGELKESRVALLKRPLWKRALRRIDKGQMPPEDSPQLSADEKTRLTDWMRFAIEHVDCDPRNRDPGPAFVRRLNRTEYFNTLRDLLGMEVTQAKSVGIPDDAVLDGFDTQAAALGMSATLVEKYFAAADSAIGELFGDKAEGAGTRDGNRRRARRAANESPGTNAANADLSRDAAYERLFFVRPDDNLSERAAAQQIIGRFVSRAYRRPVREDDVVPLLALFDRAKAKGTEFEAAVRTMLKPVLVSPHFLFRVELDRPPSPVTAGVPVDAYELASRLSYFVTSTMPDDELFAAAESGKLLETDELERQARRLLAGAHGRALTDNFAVQWLHLYKLADARPTTEFFPTFTDELKDAMLAEATMFFDALRKEDRSILELLDAKFTFVNETLADHYRIPGIKGDEFRRVELSPESHRGGVLGMAGVLAMTSHTFRTSPTQRGKYVLEVLFGTPPPPPPANAGVLKNDDQNKRRSPQTFREQLAQHATEKSCAGCHSKIDPLGFALDNFDAIGGWRESTEELPLDVSGVLPDGTRLNGVGDLKGVLLQKKDEFAGNVVEKMLTYALGRELDYYDECTTREVLAELTRNDYRLSGLVVGIVRSPTFMQRRPAAVGESGEQK